MPQTKERRRELRRERKDRWKKERIARAISNGVCVECLKEPSMSSTGLCKLCYKVKESGISRKNIKRMEQRKIAVLHGICNTCLNALAIDGRRSCMACICARKQGDTGNIYKKRHYQYKMAAFEKYGGPYCRCCNESIVRFLTIDHINNNGAEHRKEINDTKGRSTYVWLKKNNYPPGFQVLCYNCNIGRDKCEDKQCPHKHAQEFALGGGI